MFFKQITTAAVLAVAFTSGSAFAAEQFKTLDGIAAVPMTTDEMAQVVGTGSISVLKGMTSLVQNSTGGKWHINVTITPGSGASVTRSTVCPWYAC